MQSNFKSVSELEKELRENTKFILDACCGSRMFWFDKKQSNTIFIDNREYDKGFIDNRPNRELHPDVIMDFRKLEFPDKSFRLVVMDPPHLIGKERGCRMTKTYGVLNKNTWREDIKKGFDECWRILEDYGILIFKWNESSVKRKDVLEVIGKDPLFGHPNGSKIPTHWFCFMKIPEIPQNKQISALKSANEKVMSAEMLEKLAEIEHNQWAYWSKAKKMNHPLENVDYKDLSEPDKDMDRIWARTIQKIISEAILGERK